MEVKVSTEMLAYRFSPQTLSHEFGQSIHIRIKIPRVSVLWLTNKQRWPRTESENVRNTQPQNLAQNISSHKKSCASSKMSMKWKRHFKTVKETLWRIQLHVQNWWPKRTYNLFWINNFSSSAIDMNYATKENGRNIAKLEDDYWKDNTRSMAMVIQMPKETNSKR